MESDPATAPCELLPWDSAHFGHRIARVRGHRLDAAHLESIERWAAAERVECLYFLADADDPATPPLAEAAGFRLMDIRVTLERRHRQSGAGDPAKSTDSIHPIDAADPIELLGSAETGEQPIDPAGEAHAIVVRQAVSADLPELRRIAAASHRDTRFYYDPRFARAHCDALYVRWIESCQADPAGVVLTAALPAHADRPVGYIACALGARGEGRIGLFAVGAAAQGRGAGSRLLAAAGRWFAARGADPVSVVTQGRNVRAQRIYQRAGLRTAALGLWYHRWLDGGSPTVPAVRGERARR